MITDCCGADFVEEGDLCSDCGEHAVESEEEDFECCESSAYGFNCTCIKPSYKDSDDYADYAYEQYRDGLDEDERLNDE